MLLLAVVFARPSRRRQGRERGSPTASCSATPLLAYALLLFAHALVAACLFGAWAALFRAGPVGRGRARDVAAGALLGLAVLSEYPAAIPALDPRRWSRRGGLPARAPPDRPRRRFLSRPSSPATTRPAFGRPLPPLGRGSRRTPPSGSWRGTGLFGVGLPRPAILAAAPPRPVEGASRLHAPPPAAPVGPRRRAAQARPRAVSPRSSLVPLALLLTYGGYPNWHGGFTVGARYLVGALPFLLLPLAFVRWGPLATALAGASTAAVALTTLVFPFVPPGFPLPWGSFAAPLLSEGLVAPNLLHLVWRPLAIVVPFALVLAAAVAATGRARLAPFLAGAFLWTAAGLALPLLSPLSPPLVVQRGYVEEVYFTREGALARSMPAGCRCLRGSWRGRSWRRPCRPLRGRSDAPDPEAGDDAPARRPVGRPRIERELEERDRVRRGRLVDAHGERLVRAACPAGRPRRHRRGGRRAGRS